MTSFYFQDKYLVYKSISRGNGIFYTLICYGNIGEEVKHNMMKQLMGIALSAAMVMSIAGSVSAHTHYTPPAPIAPVSKISVTNEDTYVKTNALSTVTTGNNAQTGGSWLFGGSKLTTGLVSTVGATAESQINTTFLPDCNCSKVGDITVLNKETTVRTRASTTVTTGGNTQTATISHPEMTTGAVNTVYSNSTSSVNYTDFGVSGS